MSNSNQPEPSDVEPNGDNQAPILQLEGLHVRNYRVLRDVRIDGITPLTAFIGTNGSGKSTVLDVFSFLAEALTAGLRPALEARGGINELRSRNSTGPISITVIYRERPDAPRMLYHLEVEDTGSDRNPYVPSETLSQEGSKTPYFHVELGVGHLEEVIGSQDSNTPSSIAFASKDVLALSILSQFADWTRMISLYRFLTGWYLADMTPESIRGKAKKGPIDRVSPGGENLAQVVSHLKENDPERLAAITRTLTRWVPLLKEIEVETDAQARPLLKIVDKPFQRPILDQFASEGTLKLLAYLTVLYDPKPPPLIGMEEPENYVHPRLVPELAEACRVATERSQVLVTTHSPYFVGSLRPEEVWVLSRDDKGYTQARRAADIQGIPEFMQHGANLGDLWMEGYFQTPDWGNGKSAPEPSARSGQVVGNG